MQVRVDYINKKEKVKTEVVKDLQWYDTLKKEMMRFKGGCLKFEYKYDKYMAKNGYINPYRLLPTVSKVFKDEIKFKKNEEEVKKVFLDFNNYNVVNASIVSRNEDYVIFDVPEIIEEDFIYSLERSGIKYNILD